MKKLLFIRLSVLSFFASAQNVEEIIQKAEDRLKGNTSYSEPTVTTIRPNWEREMKIKTWTKGDHFSVTLVLSPARDKGTVFLKRDKELWNFVPSIDRTVKMPPSMLSQSWMGTDVTNDDILRESSMKRDYDKKILGSESIEGYDCYQIELIPKAGVNSIWGKIHVWISKDENMQLKVEYYDEDDALINTILSKSIQKMDGLLQPTITEIIPANKPGNKTRMTLTVRKLNLPVDEALFTTQYMKRIQ